MNTDTITTRHTCSLYSTLSENGHDLTDHDLAHLADWASYMKEQVPNPDWKKAYSLMREGADLLLRRRAMSRVYESVPEEKSKTFKA